MSISLKEFGASLYDKEMRAEFRKNPKKFLSDDSPFKNAQKYKVITSTKDITYIAIPHRDVLLLANITAAGNMEGEPTISISTVASASSCLGTLSSVHMLDGRRV